MLAGGFGSAVLEHLEDSRTLRPAPRDPARRPARPLRHPRQAGAAARGGRLHRRGGRRARRWPRSAHRPSSKRSGSVHEASTGWTQRHPGSDGGSPPASLLRLRAAARSAAAPGAGLRLRGRSGRVEVAAARRAPLLPPRPIRPRSVANRSCGCEIRPLRRPDHVGGGGPGPPGRRRPARPLHRRWWSGPVPSTIAGTVVVVTLEVVGSSPPEPHGSDEEGEGGHRRGSGRSPHPISCPAGR